MLFGKFEFVSVEGSNYKNLNNLAHPTVLAHSLNSRPRLQLCVLLKFTHPVNRLFGDVSRQLLFDSHYGRTEASRRYHGYFQNNARVRRIHQCAETKKKNK